jgi:membrane-bound metal-dependent hydrolase YbcI (DUF457 family)
MWVFDAIGYLYRRYAHVLLPAPAVLLLVGWALWLRAPRAPSSWREHALLGALVCGTVAEGTDLAMAAYWRWIFPWLHPGVGYCAVLGWPELLAFFATLAAAGLAVAGRGAGRLPTLMAMALRLALRNVYW